MRDSEIAEALVAVPDLLNKAVHLITGHLQTLDDYDGFREIYGFLHDYVPEELFWRLGDDFEAQFLDNEQFLREHEYDLFVIEQIKEIAEFFEIDFDDDTCNDTLNRSNRNDEEDNNDNTTVGQLSFLSHELDIATKNISVNRRSARLISEEDRITSLFASLLDVDMEEER